MSKAHPPTGTADPAASNANTRRLGWASVVGSVVEYYDFTLFGLAAAVVFGPLFFPHSAPATQVIGSLLTFAVGYLGRPIGGILFSHFGDRLGRKPMLVVTLVTMGVATLAIGLLPTYQSVGVWAPILLALCRVVQGMGAGAEYVGALVLMAETGDKAHLGVRTALPGTGVFAGIAIATAVFAWVSTLPSAQLLAWGWRLPFLASLLTFGAGLWIRRGVSESPEFTSLKSRDALVSFPLFRALRTSWREILIGWGINGPYLAFSSLTQVFLLAYVTGAMKLPASFGLSANLISSILAIGFTVLAGYLGDRWGRRRVWLAGCAVFLLCGVLLVPAFASRQELVIILIMILGISVGLATLYATQGALLSMLFPPESRLTGVVLVREPMAALIAGPTPAIAASLVSVAGGLLWPVATLFIAGAIIAGVTVILAWRLLGKRAESPAHTSLARRAHTATRRTI